MPGSIGEEDDILRRLKKNEQFYAAMAKQSEKPAAKGKLGTKQVTPTSTSENLGHIANKRFKTP